VWARIVDVLRALILFIGYAVIVAGQALCGEKAKQIVVTKLGGAFVLCCLASLSTRDRRWRTGWVKLSEIVCSRKTFLLLIYIVAWSYIVNAAAELWTSRSIMYVLLDVVLGTVLFRSINTHQVIHLTATCSIEMRMRVKGRRQNGLGYNGRQPVC